MLKLLHLFLLIPCLMPLLLGAQEHDPDSTFREAQRLVREEHPIQALQLMEVLTHKHPENLDYRIYQARIYYWTDRPDTCRSLLAPLVKEHPENQEATRLLIAAIIDMQDYPIAIDQLQMAQQQFPKDKRYYLFQEARVHDLMNNNKTALELLAKVEQMDAGKEPDVAYLKTTILQKQKNTVSAGYLNTAFSKPGFKPFQFFHVQYNRTEKRITTIARLNYAHAFSRNAIQGEVDVYPRLGKYSYLYLNAGISEGGNLFPLLRIGGDFFYERHLVGASLGGRFFSFNESSVTLITAQVSFTPKDWRLSYRPYLAFDSGSTNPSHVVQLRRSFFNSEAYLQLDLQYGSTPYYYWVSNDFDRISAYRIGLSGQVRIGDNFFIQPAFMYELEEYFPGMDRNRFNSQLILSKRF